MRVTTGANLRSKGPKVKVTGNKNVSAVPQHRPRQTPAVQFENGATGWKVSPQTQCAYSARIFISLPVPLSVTCWTLDLFLVLQKSAHFSVDRDSADWSRCLSCRLLSSESKDSWQSSAIAGLSFFSGPASCLEHFTVWHAQCYWHWRNWNLLFDVWLIADCCTAPLDVFW